MTDLLHSCFGINKQNHLTIGGLDTIDLAKEFGTPAYIMDEQFIRKNCRIYRNATRQFYGEDSLPMYASKAFCCRRIYEIIGDEGLGADVVSSGELYTALSAGFPAERICFHSNNKTNFDIKFGIENGVGCFVVDNREELEFVSQTAVLNGKKQRILLRISPGIDPHTHRAVVTGNVDSKFGTAIVTGQALELIRYALTLPGINLAGLHCHIGSQIFEREPFDDAAENMVAFIAAVKKELGYEVRELNLGGGFGVRYIPEQPELDYAAMIEMIAGKVLKLCYKYNIAMPTIMLEPGRSIVAASGLTLYTVGTVKEITGFKNYVSVDGGMPDNPRYALYASPYTVLVANRAGDEADYSCTIAGRCCESGDLIAENIKIQRCTRGDILAVLVTGAYNYSMASNYNRIARPPVIMVNEGKAYTAVRRESLEDLIRNDC